MAFEWLQVLIAAVYGRGRQMSIDQRKSPRTRTLLGARACYNHRNATLDCVVRNISETGALLVISDAVLLPAAFELDIAHRHRSYNARVRWRSGTRIGVSFEAEDAGPAATASADAASRLKLAEQDNARLKNRILQLTEAG